MLDVNTRPKYWVLWLIFGILLMLGGFFLLSSPVIASIASVFVFAILLLSAGVVHIITAFLDKHSNHLWLHLVIAAFTIVVGLLMLFSPGITLAALTLLIAAFFLSNGLFRIIGSLVSRFKGWGWFFLNGLISLVLGILILIHWPSSSLWVIGLFIGIDLIFAGWSLVMISVFFKKASVPA
jgi:uncharacterized membrane protein HdeD (DUF308 family)